MNDAPPREVPITADRQQIAAHLLGPGVTVPGGEPDGFPATAPPAAVHAEILHDLGSNADALDDYLNGGLRYAEISTDGTTHVTVTLRGATGAAGRVQLSLTSDEVPVGLPYNLVELLQAPTGEPGR